MSKDFRKEVLTFSTKESFKEVITFIKDQLTISKIEKEKEGKGEGKEEEEDGEGEEKIEGEREEEIRYILHWVFDAPIVEPCCF